MSSRILWDAAPTIPQAAGDAAQAPAVPVELLGVADELKNGDGFWRTCSGCHESEDGHPVGHYPFSAILNCDLGSGCHECGGIGAVWDNTDYGAMADAWDAQEAQAAIEYDDVVQICEAHGIGLPVECVEMVVEIIRHAAPVPPAAAAPICQKRQMQDGDPVGPQCYACEENGCTKDKAARSDVRKVLEDLFIANPKGELGPTDDPESQYRFGYNTAIEDALEALLKHLEHSNGN